MGAYYTKEDIIGNSRNTIIPYLFSIYGESLFSGVKPGQRLAAAAG